MRCLAVAIVLAGCEPHLVLKPLPPLARPQAPHAHAIVVHDIGLEPGEHWRWDVQVGGMSVGRIELAVGDTEVTSHFKTDGLASMFTHVEHELVTVIDRDAARPATSEEKLERGGKARQFSTQFAGTTAHSLHSALGAIRAWAHPDAEPGYLDIVQADQTYRLELAQPVARDGMLRIDGKAHGPDIDSVSITIWLDASRTPVRFEARDGDDRVIAQLIDS